MKMKILILLSIVFYGYSCEKLVDHTNFIRIHNNTKDTIQVYPCYYYPDTTLSTEKPRLIMIYPNTHNGGLESKEDWKEKLPNDTISIFILSKDTVDMYSWDKIRNDYNILKRFDLSIKDLEKQSWTVTYP